MPFQVTAQEFSKKIFVYNALSSRHRRGSMGRYLSTSFYEAYSHSLTLPGLLHEGAFKA